MFSVEYITDHFWFRIFGFLVLWWKISFWWWSCLSIVMNRTKMPELGSAWEGCLFIVILVLWL